MNNRTECMYVESQHLEFPHTVGSRYHALPCYIRMYSKTVDHLIIFAEYVHVTFWH